MRSTSLLPTVWKWCSCQCRCPRWGWKQQLTKLYLPLSLFELILLFWVNYMQFTILTDPRSEEHFLPLACEMVASMQQLKEPDVSLVETKNGAKIRLNFESISSGSQKHNFRRVFVLLCRCLVCFFALKLSQSGQKKSKCRCNVTT